MSSFPLAPLTHTPAKAATDGRPPSLFNLHQLQRSIFDSCCIDEDGENSSPIPSITDIFHEDVSTLLSRLRAA